MTASQLSSAKLPTQWGEFQIQVFVDNDNQKEHVALIFGDLSSASPVLCRIHSECLTGDAFFSLRCDCGSQLQEAMQRIAQRGSGVILYLRQEGRNIGLGNKIKAYQLQDAGADTVEANEALGFEADERQYDICLEMLTSLNVDHVELMTNNPNKIKALEDFGIKVSKRAAIITGENSHNKSYLETKRDKLGHISS